MASTISNWRFGSAGRSGLGGETGCVGWGGGGDGGNLAAAIIRKLWPPPDRRILASASRWSYQSLPASGSKRLSMTRMTKWTACVQKYRQLSPSFCGKSASHKTKTPSAVRREGEKRRRGNAPVYFLFLARRARQPASPAMPIPNKAIVVGSGTADELPPVVPATKTTSLAHQDVQPMAK